MLYLALAIMLGHNFVEHKHHDSADSHHHHHHAEEAHHHDTNTDDEGESNGKDLGYFFSFIQHSSYEPTYINPTLLVDFSFQIPGFAAYNNTAFVFRQVALKVWQNAPPFKEKFFNSIRLSLDGLRAPPAFSA